MLRNLPSPLQASAEEVAHEDLKWAVGQTRACGSDRSCLMQRTCLGEPVCEALWPIGRCAGFVSPTQSAARCGYCVVSFRGHICFCPTRWALHRADAAAA